MSLSILCTGDIHLGRHPAQIADQPDPQALSPTGAWRNFVQTALNRRVDIVALTGDIVDESNKFFEAYSVLHDGVQRLVDAGIQVLAVAGNHDYDVLPRLADQLPDFHLLGRGRSWEVWPYESPQGQQLSFQGWSFPSQHVRSDPLEDYPGPTADVPTIGLLHCDCDAPGSSYGPVSLARLRETGITAWLLGHVHGPKILHDAHPLVVYPGSLQGLSPREPGMHAAVLVTIEPGPTVQLEHLPLAPLRWEHLQVALDGVDTEESLQSALISAMRQRHDTVYQQGGDTRLVGCRLKLHGRTPLYPNLPNLMATAQEGLRPRYDDIDYFIEKVHIAARPQLDLEQIASSSDPAGLLARRIQTLESGEQTDEYQKLLAEGRAAMLHVQARNQFIPLQATPPDDEQVREVLLEAGLRVLDALMTQKQESTH
jgi:exonuclease SbcD